MHWAAYVTHGKEFLLWILSKFPSNNKQINGNFALKSVNRGSTLTNVGHFDDSHQHRVKQLKPKIFEFFNLVIGQGFKLYFSEVTRSDDDPLGIAFENTHDPDLICKCIEEYGYPVKYPFLSFIMDKKFQVIDSQHKCFNARRQIMPVLSCIKKQNPLFDPLSICEQDHFRVNLEDTLMANGFIERKTHDYY